MGNPYLRANETLCIGWAKYKTCVRSLKGGHSERDKDTHFKILRVKFYEIIKPQNKNYRSNKSLCREMKEKISVIWKLKWGNLPR